MTVPLDLDLGPARSGTERIALVDLLDRLLAGGAVVTGDLVISVAEVDLVQISLRALIMAVRDEMLGEDEP